MLLVYLLANFLIYTVYFIVAIFFTFFHQCLSPSTKVFYTVYDINVSSTVFL